MMNIVVMMNIVGIISIIFLSSSCSSFGVGARIGFDDK
jgi:hypothetical protein